MNNESVDEYFSRMEREADAEKYENRHRPQNQKTIIRGVPVDPVLREYFDNHDNAKRPYEETGDWQDRAFIVSCPGNVFDVRCLDGGAWDRSTWKGRFDDLDDAVEYARSITPAEMLLDQPQDANQLSLSLGSNSAAQMKEAHMRMGEAIESLIAEVEGQRPGGGPKP